MRPAETWAALVFFPAILRERMVNPAPPFQRSKFSGRGTRPDRNPIPKNRAEITMEATTANPKSAFPYIQKLPHFITKPTL